jgi:hypothetical protein
MGSIAEMGSVATVRACPKTGSINTGVGITIKEGIRASSSIYSGGVCK